MAENIAEPVVTKKSSGGVFISFVFILSLLALAGSGYLYYCGMLFKNQVEAQFTDVNARYAAMSAADVANTQQLQQLQNEVALTQKHMDSISANNVTIYQVSELINLANQVLVVYDDVASATRLLSYAHDQLNGNNDAIFTGLKFALGGDIERLDQTPHLDRALLGGTLDGLMDTVTKLHLSSQNALPKITTATNNETKLHKFVNNIRQSLFGLVSVTRSDTPNLLLPDQELIAKQNIKFDIFNAKVALLGRDESSWVYNLNGAKTYMHNYFTAYSGADKINAKLDELLKVDVATTKVNIDATLTALNKLKTLQN